MPCQLHTVLSACREIIFCGEVVTVGLLERCIKAFPSVHFLNLYSISEAHDIACADLSTWYQSEKVSPAFFCLYYKYVLIFIISNNNEILIECQSPARTIPMCHIMKPQYEVLTVLLKQWEDKVISLREKKPTKNPPTIDESQEEITQKCQEVMFFFASLVTYSLK